MRVIKFRGKSVDTNDWIYGDLLQFYLDGKPVKTNFSILPFECFKTSETTYETHPVTVLYDSIGQFTGLYDANGREIYEGDILREKGTGNLVEVVYDSPEFCFKINVYGYCFLNNPENFEVIGNICDNPDYLKASEE